MRGWQGQGRKKMPNSRIERYLEYPNPGYMEAQREAMIEDMQVENIGFVYPAWKAWIQCPLFKWLDKRKRARERTEGTLQAIEYARATRRMAIVHKDGIEFRKTAIVRKGKQ